MHLRTDLQNLGKVKDGETPFYGVSPKMGSRLIHLYSKCTCALTLRFVFKVKDGETPPYAEAPEIPFPPQLLPGAFDSVDLRLEGDGCTWHRPTTLAGVLALKSSHPQARTLKSLCVVKVCV